MFSVLLFDRVAVLYVSLLDSRADLASQFDICNRYSDNNTFHGKVVFNIKFDIGL